MHSAARAHRRRRECEGWLPRRGPMSGRVVIPIRSEDGVVYAGRQDESG